MQRVVQHARELLGAPAERAAQIGTAHVADEQRVTGEDRVRLVAPLVSVIDQDRDRLRRVPGRLEHGHPHRAELHRVTVGHRRERILGLGPRAEVDDGAGALAQLEVAGDEVRVEVGQEHVADPATHLIRVGQVLRDVTLGVDDGRQAARLVRDQVRGVGEAAEVVLLENHRPETRLSSVAGRSGCRAWAPPTRRRSPWPDRWKPSRR